MLQQQHIVCIALPAWEGDYVKTIVQMMSMLSRHNKVLYVDYEYTWKDLLLTWMGKKQAPVKRMLGLAPRLRRLSTPYSKEIYVLTPPPVFPVNWIGQGKLYEAALALNAACIKPAIKKAMHSLKIKNPIVINAFNPFFGLPLLGALDEQLHLYYCYDEIGAASWTRRHGQQIEQRFMQQVDGVITSSEHLCQRKQLINSNCFLVKNGVDFDHFSRIAYSTPPIKKTVGYIGSLDERFDTETMTYAISQMPETDFLFIGRIINEGARQQLERFANVRFLGPQPAQQIPQLLKNIHAGVIPYLKNELTRGVYPLKINEYLAAGKAVVMTDFAPLPEFSEVVCCAQNKQEFLEGLRRELQHSGPEKKRQRMAVARGNSWEKRTEEFSSIVEQLIQSKNAKTSC